MPLLLDTCVLYWLAIDQSKLSRSAAAALRAEPDGLYVSTVSAFEVALNHAKRRVELPEPPEQWYRATLRAYGIRSKPITTSIALRSVALPEHHKDPFDRLIIAKAARHRLPVVTSDRHFPSYKEIVTIW